MIVLADPTTIDLLRYINSAGVIGILAFIVIAGWRGWWVSKGQYDELKARLAAVEEQNVKWMDLAFKATSISEQVSDILRNKR